MQKRSTHVSIPLKSGHIVILVFGVDVRRLMSFNPLKIGSYCNITIIWQRLLSQSFNPLKIGSYCNGKLRVDMSDFNVSIPLKSGHIVINQGFNDTVRACCFNPLKIGSYCNSWRTSSRENSRGVSIPLKSGHIVIEKRAEEARKKEVSIPLKSGHIVI